MGFKTEAVVVVDQVALDDRLAIRWATEIARALNLPVGVHP
jgi:hypothetical protein